MPYPLVLHSWLFAPHSATRNRLYPILERAGRYDSHGAGFHALLAEPYISAIGSDALINNAFRIMKCAQDCVDSRIHAMQYLTTLDDEFGIRVKLPPGFEADLMDIIMNTLQSGSDEDKYYINDYGNIFLE
jgi:hypothetical protein